MSEKIYLLEVVEIGNDVQTMSGVCRFLFLAGELLSTQEWDPVAAFVTCDFILLYRRPDGRETFAHQGQCILSPNFVVGTQQFRPILTARYYRTCELRAGLKQRLWQPFEHPFWNNMHQETSTENGLRQEAGW